MSSAARRLASLLFLVARPAVAAEAPPTPGCQAAEGIPAEQSLARCAEVRARAAGAGDAKAEADALQTTAELLLSLSRQEEALARFQEVLALRRQLHDRKGEAEALNDIGAVFFGWSRMDQALSYFEQALTLRRDTQDRAGEGITLNNIGFAYSQQGSYQRALQAYEQALALKRAAGDRKGEAITLANIGADDLLVGRTLEGIERLQEALALQRELKATRGQARTLNNLGFAEEALSRHERALERYQEALALHREARDRQGEAATLGNLGAAHTALGQPPRAVELLEQALAVQREIGDRRGEAKSLSLLGAAHAALGEWPRALDEDHQALAIQSEINDRDGRSRTLAGLMAAWRALGSPSLAIFYGKEAVNAVQRIRGEIQSLPLETRRGYLGTRAGLYRSLGDLLLGAGRLPEAEQVLGLAKEEEYGSFIRPDGALSPVALVNLTPREALEARRYEELAQPVATLSQVAGALRARKPRSPAEEQQLAEQEGRLASAREALAAFLAEQGESFALRETAPRPGDPEPPRRALAAALDGRGAGTAVLYTLLMPDRYRVLMITPQGQVAREWPIERAALAKKVLAFREVLQDPASDPLPLARELYEVLLGPIAQDLKSARSDTLLWSLDGALRYLPVAALHDGTRYLVERFRTGVLTPGSFSEHRRAPARPWTASGFGMSRGAPGFPPLPGVREELGEIVRTPRSRQGVLPGEVWLDEAFTWEAMRSALESGERRPVVHVASHFQFQPGAAAESFLLLGDGRRLTLEQLAEHPRLFDGVEVLSLSACDTAVETGEEGGREVEGFATLAQRQGAGAVLATLWSVQDESARTVMARFYRERQAHPERTKAEALRRAQLALWTTSAGAPSRKAARSATPALGPGGRERAPRTYSHPYYWAPFVLLGDGR